MPLNSDYCCGWSLMEGVRDKNKAVIDFKFLYVNSAWCRLTGLDNPAGKTMYEVFPDTEKHWLEMFTRVLKTGKAEQLIDIRGGMGEWDAFAVIIDKERDEMACIFSPIFTSDTCIISHNEKRRAINQELFSIIERHPNDDFISALRKNFADYL